MLSAILLAILCLALQPRPTQPSPSSDPALTDPHTDEVMREQGRRPAAPAPIAPRSSGPAQRLIPALPGAAADLRPSRGVVYPEGAFLSARAGVITKGPAGALIFVPAPAPATDAEPAPAREAPMTLIKCQKLAQLASALETLGAETPITLSGQVFTYHDRAYLLPSVFSLTPATPAPSEPPAAPEPGASPDAPAAPRTDNAPSADDIMRALESRRPTPRAMDARGAGLAPPAPAPSARANKPRTDTLLPEGALLTARRGRLVRTGPNGAAANDLAFAIDNDPDSPAPAPMPLLPCALVQSMESAAAAHGDAVVFRLSGRVTTFAGRNYILPTMFQVVRPSDVSSLQ